MIVTMNSQALAAELRLLNKVVPSKPVLAILSHALLTAEAMSGSLHLYATDLEVGLSGDCVGRVDAPGRVALPVARLLSMVEQFANGDVTLSLEKLHLTVACGAFKSRLQVLPADDFPTEPPDDGSESVFDAMTMHQLISRTRYAISATSSKFALQGALLTLSGKNAVMATTDGKRLAVASALRAGPDAKVIVPMKCLDLLADLLTDGDATMKAGKRHLAFILGGHRVTSRVIDGQFPRYDRIIPGKDAQGNEVNDKHVNVDRAQLTAALRRVAQVAEENGAVYFDVIDAMTMRLSAASAGIGQADEPVAIRYAGPPIKVCANGEYVLDFLNVAGNQEVTMKLKDESSAALFMDGEDHLAVVMLMRR